MGPHDRKPLVRLAFIVTNFLSLSYSRSDQQVRTFFDSVLYQSPPVVLVVRLKTVIAHLVNLTENIKNNKNGIIITTSTADKLSPSSIHEQT